MVVKLSEKNEKLFEENIQFNKKFGELIATYRKNKGYSQDKLSGIMNFASNSISQIELGKRNCHVYNFLLLIYILDIPVEEVSKLIYNSTNIPENIYNSIKEEKNKNK